jgi:hypothetical protein
MGEAMDMYLRGLQQDQFDRAVANAEGETREVAASLRGNVAVRAFLTRELGKYDPHHPYLLDDDPTFRQVFNAGARAKSSDAARQLGREMSAKLPITPLLQRMRQSGGSLELGVQLGVALESLRGELKVANGEIGKANEKLLAADQRIKALEASLARANAEADRFRGLQQQAMEDNAGNLALRVILGLALKEGFPDLPILNDMALRERIAAAAAKVLRSAQVAISAGQIPRNVNPFEEVRAYAADLWRHELRSQERARSADILNFPLDARIGTGGGEAGG